MAAPPVEVSLVLVLVLATLNQMTMSTLRPVTPADSQRSLPETIIKQNVAVLSLDQNPRCQHRRFPPTWLLRSLKKLRKNVSWLYSASNSDTDICFSDGTPQTNRQCGRPSSTFAEGGFQSVQLNVLAPSIVRHCSPCLHTPFSSTTAEAIDVYTSAQ